MSASEMIDKNETLIPYHIYDYLQWLLHCVKNFRASAVPTMEHSGVKVLGWRRGVSGAPVADHYWSSLRAVCRYSQVSAQACALGYIRRYNGQEVGRRTQSDIQHSRLPTRSDINASCYLKEYSHSLSQHPGTNILRPICLSSSTTSGYVPYVGQVTCGPWLDTSALCATQNSMEIFDQLLKTAMWRLLARLSQHTMKD
jgi:hypothetical protein